MQDKRTFKELSLDIGEIDELYRYAMFLTSNGRAGEGLVIETYDRVLQVMRWFRGVCDQKVCLYVILRNLWLDQLARSRSGTHLFGSKSEIEIDNDTDTSSRVPCDPNLEQLTPDIVRAALLKLSPESQELIFLRETGDLSYQQIAKVLDCDRETVISGLGRARANLRTLLSSMIGCQLT